MAHRSFAFSVPGNKASHARLNQRADMIPARFDVDLLIDPEAAKDFLATQIT